MATEVSNENGVVSNNYPTCIQSVNRISKLPVVESTIEAASLVYERVKDYNSVTNWTLSTAESTMSMAVEAGKPIATPVIKNLEGPIKKVDNVLCSGLDYVESKLPAVKLPPSELFMQIYSSTKDYVANHVNPVMETAFSYVEPAFDRARSALDAVEPVLERAKNIVDPALERAHNLKDAAVHKMEEYLHKAHNHENSEDVQECDECLEVARKLREQRERSLKEQEQS